MGQYLEAGRYWRSMKCVGTKPVWGREPRTIPTLTKCMRTETLEQWTKQVPILRIGAYP